MTTEVTLITLSRFLYSGPRIYQIILWDIWEHHKECDLWLVKFECKPSTAAATTATTKPLTCADSE
jgi:hypothetical protein